MAQWLKVVGALMLLASYVLPISSCAPVRLDAQGALAGSTGGGGVVAKPAVAPVTPPAREYRYIASGDLTSFDDWVRVLSFAIPAAVVLYTRMRPISRLTLVLWPLEPVFLALVLVEVWAMTFLARTEVGAYVANGGVLMIGVAWLAEALVKIRFYRVSTRTMGRALCVSALLATLIVACFGDMPAESKAALGAVLAVYLFILLALGLEWMARRRRAAPS